MKRLATVGFLTCILFLTGCGKITGQWTLDCINPESERQNFDLKCLVLNEDNTFTVRASEESQATQMSGTYCYDDDTDALTFTPEGGPPRTYTAKVEWNGKMKVCPTDQATWTAYLKKVKCERTCEKPCAQPCEKKATPKGQCPMHKAEPAKAGPES
jgi:hypothetical protein